MSRPCELVSVNVSAVKGQRKRPVERASVTPDGIDGDAHAGPWHRQISVLGSESIALFAGRLGRPLEPGDFAENLTVRGLDMETASLLDRLEFGDVDLEVTQIGKACHGRGCAIFQQAGDCIMPREGLFCRVVHPGVLKAGMSGSHWPFVLTCRIIALGDGGTAGSGEDRTGARIAEMLAERFAGSRLRLAIEQVAIRNDVDQLRAALDGTVRPRHATGCEIESIGGHPALRRPAELTITTGATGVSSRDIAPEVIGPYCDKLAPGIAEPIRAACGQRDTRALCRSLAGTKGTRLIYALPGGVHAVEEQMVPISDTLEHLLHVVRGMEAR
jgi:molybdopterin adenylyltransferase